MRLIYCAGGKSVPFLLDFPLHSPTMRLEIVQNEPASFGVSQNCPRSPTRFATIARVRQAAREGAPTGP